MKKFFVIMGLLLGSFFLAHAQHNEVSTQLGSGLFSFHGNKAVQESFFNIVIGVPPPNVGSASYTNDPWSTGSSFSWGVTMQVQHVAKNNFIAGLQLGYESLATKTKIIGGNDLGRFIAFQQGISTFTYEYINFHPFFGQRFGHRQIGVDLTAGLDMAVSSHNWERGRGVTANNELYLTSRKHDTPSLDLRPRLNTTVYLLS